MKTAIALFWCILLAGCVSAEERAAQQAAQDRARAEAYRNQVHGQCRAYGFTAGTQDYRNCLMQVDMAYRQQDEAQRQLILQQYLQQQGIFRR